MVDNDPGQGKGSRGRKSSSMEVFLRRRPRFPLIFSNVGFGTRILLSSFRQRNFLTRLFIVIVVSKSGWNLARLVASAIVLKLLL